MDAGNARAIAGALAAAALFGASTPAAKALGANLHPLLLASLLYSGSGLGLGIWLAVRRLRGMPSDLGISRTDLPWLGGAVLSGGVVAPGLLMFALAAAQATVVSLLLNLESVLTALLAWFVFGENFDRRIAAGMVLITGAGVVLSLAPHAGATTGNGTWLVAGACLFWAIDNNLTRKISAGDPVFIACIKGCVAGVSNLALAAASGAAPPGTFTAVAAMVVGLAGYGASLALFVIALRELGAARVGAYFATAPFIGAAIAIGLLGEEAGPTFWAAALMMAAGVWLHVSERHEHTHTHSAIDHTHSHSHDEHHQHEHDFDWDGKEPHRHAHRHASMTHRHPHYPDIHHRHRH